MARALARPPSRSVDRIHQFFTVMREHRACYKKGGMTKRRLMDFYYSNQRALKAQDRRAHAAISLSHDWLFHEWQRRGSHGSSGRFFRQYWEPVSVRFLDIMDVMDKNS